MAKGKGKGNHAEAQDIGFAEGLDKAMEAEIPAGKERQTMKREKQVAEKLIAAGKTITFMESCTAGLLASMLTDTEGVSAVFKGSIVTYSNEAKVAAGVSPFVIQEYGVYSAQCAREMAAAAQETYCADIAVGITGTTGNRDRENEGSREGEAYCCIIAGGDIHDYRIQVQTAGMTRREIKELYAADVYEKLLELL